MPVPIPRDFLNKTNRRTMKETSENLSGLRHCEGPDIRLAVTSDASSWSIISGCILAEGRFGGRKDIERGGGLPIGEPYVMLCTRFGKDRDSFVVSRTHCQASGL